MKVPSSLSAEPIGSAFCALPGCRRIVSPKNLMCKPHWDLVPEDLQKSVYETHAAFEKASKETARKPGLMVTTVQAQAVGSAREAYLKAREAAIRSLMDRVPPTAGLKTRETT